MMNGFLTAPQARAYVFEYIKEKGQLTIDELQNHVREKNLNFGPTVYVLDFLRGVEGTKKVTIDWNGNSVRYIGN